MSDNKRFERSWQPRTSMRRQSCCRWVLNIEHLSSPKSLGWYSSCSAITGNYETPKAVATSDAATVDSGELDLVDTISTNSAPFCRVCLNNNRGTPCFEQVKNDAGFIKTRNRQYYHWWKRKIRASIKQLTQENIAKIAFGTTATKVVGFEEQSRQCHMVRTHVVQP